MMTQKQLNHISGYIAETLYYKYNYYYNNVYYDFIIEAVKNTLNDLKINDNFSEKIDIIHKHIINNYI